MGFLTRGENSFLIPTGEVPLMNLLRGALLEENQLPQSYCALTPCFRAEVYSKSGIVWVYIYFSIEEPRCELIGS